MIYHLVSDCYLAVVFSSALSLYPLPLVSSNFFFTGIVFYIGVVFGTVFGILFLSS